MVLCCNLLRGERLGNLATGSAVSGLAWYVGRAATSPRDMMLRAPRGGDSLAIAIDREQTESRLPARPVCMLVPRCRCRDSFMAPRSRGRGPRRTGLKQIGKYLRDRRLEAGVVLLAIPPAIQERRVAVMEPEFPSTPCGITRS